MKKISLKTLFKTALVLCLSVSTVYGASVIFPYQGGTGTSTVPTIGQVLLGQSNGTYAPVATSSLGISGSSFTGTYPIIVSGSVISTGFSTSTTNVFSNAQTINNNLTVTGTTALGNTTMSNATSSVHVFNTSAWLKGLLGDSTNATGTSGQVLQSTGTSTLWTTLSGVLSGGVVGKVPYWTASNNLGNSTIFTNGTVSGINATSSTVTFNIQGNAGTNDVLNVASSTGTSMLKIASNGRVYVGTTTSPNSSFIMIDAGVSSSSNEAINIYGNKNDYFEDNLFNLSGGTGAQACRTATANNGTLTSGFISMCANSSTFNNPTTYNTGAAGDTSLMGFNTGDFILVNATPTKSMLFVTGSASSTTNTRMKIDGNGAVMVATTTSTPTYGFTVATTTQFTQKVIANTQIGIATTTPVNSLSVASGTIAVTEYDWGTGTSTSMTIDWQKANTQQIKISTSAITVNFLNATTTPGAYLSVFVCNPAAGTAGAITWNGVYWPSQTAPTQTTSANHCDKWSFQAVNGTSSVIVIGSATVNF